MLFPDRSFFLCCPTSGHMAFLLVVDQWREGTHLGYLRTCSCMWPEPNGLSIGFGASFIPPIMTAFPFLSP